LATQTKKADIERDLRDRSLLVQGANIWIGNRFAKGSILIEDGKIKRVARRLNREAFETINASNLLALPGLVDVHVHLRDMKLSYKEDFATGTAAAAAGGFTTVLDMPNTLPPTDTALRLIEKQKRAKERIRVNVGFHVAARSDPGTVARLARAGAFSLKLYMPKPIAPLNVKSDVSIREMMRSARRSRILVTVHAEDLKGSYETSEPESFSKLAEARPPAMESRAIERITRCQRITGCSLHFCHLTLESSLERISAASSKITSEVTPHHILLSKRILGKLGWRAWMVPPLRSEAERERVLEAVRSGSCDVIASDHAPHAISEKKLRPGQSAPGVPGLETTLPLMLTLVNKGILTFSRLVDLTAKNPAKIFGLTSKGRIRPGYDGDLVLVDPKKKGRINSDRFFSKAKYSPFDGYRTSGTVVSTIVGGTIAYQDGNLVGREGSGSVLRSGLPH
jgi:dihydroorotase